MSNQFLLFWVIPSLISLLWLIHDARYNIKPIEPADYSFLSWIILFILCILYPTVILYLFSTKIWPILVKTRKIYKEDYRAIY